MTCHGMNKVIKDPVNITALFNATKLYMVWNCLIVRLHKDTSTDTSISSYWKLVGRELQQWLGGTGRAMLPITEGTVTVKKHQPQMAIYVALC